MLCSTVIMGGFKKCVSGQIGLRVGSWTSNLTNTASIPHNVVSTYPLPHRWGLNSVVFLAILPSLPADSEPENRWGNRSTACRQLSLEPIVGVDI